MRDQADHESLMRRAIDVARQNPAAPFGAVLVDAHNEQVVAEGVNRSSENPTWHGEMDAINRCLDRQPCVDWSSLRLYTTAEPCCMCQGAVLWAGISQVFFGTSIATLRRLGWRQVDITAAEVVARADDVECRIIGGILERECNALFQAALGCRASGDS